MNAAELGQLGIIWAPLAQSIIVEGSKIIATYRENVTQEQLDKSLELSKSATWPELTFAQAPAA